MILGKFRISGHSMMPSLNPGDTIIVSSLPYYFSDPVVGDVIVYNFENKLLVKRIKKVDGEIIYTEGDNHRDSLSIKPVHRKSIIGKYIMKI